MPAGEFDFIAWIRSQQCPSSLVPLPAGDDLAILRWPADDLLLIGVDQVLDGIHFDSAVHAPRLIGRKVMNRNLSDCAAMGCLPVAAVATVALSRNTGLDYARELYLGLREAADPYDCQIVGGDTASWPGKLAMTVSILGRSAGTAPVTRAGARPGDGIYVTGPLGGSILGRHMTFLPRIREGRQLAQSGVVSAMIDLSDGLSRDLGQVCGNSGVGAILEAQAIPIHEDARALSSRDGADPLDHALHDGEDHELLFTAHATPPLGTHIGTIQAEKGIFLRRNGRILALPARGWEHAM